jgi:hypothetical protein
MVITTVDPIEKTLSTFPSLGSTVTGSSSSSIETTGRDSSLHLEILSYTFLSGV